MAKKASKAKKASSSGGRKKPAKSKKASMPKAMPGKPKRPVEGWDL